MTKLIKNINAKKMTLLLSLLLLALVFSACAQKPGQEQPEQDQPLQALDDQPGEQENGETGDQPGQEQEPEPGSDDPERPLSTEMTVTLEGEQESMAVRLWDTGDFSVYVPEDWEQDADGAWGPEDNGALRFFVQSFDGQSGEEARAALAEDYSGFSFTELDGDLFSGHNAAGGLHLSVKAVESPEACYAICAQYPDEAAEGFGIRLRMLADTFELK